MELTGTVINNRYELKGAISEGGSGYVYRAIDLKSNSTLAIKVLHSSQYAWEHVIRYRTEIDVIKRLDHPNIIKIYQWGIFEDTNRDQKHFIVMEYLDGVNLNRFIKEGIGFSVKDTIDIIGQVSEGLIKIHENSIIHGDLKPENIILKRQGGGGYSIKIIDFGLARSKEQAGEILQDEIKGTFYYMPPEQIGLICRPINEYSDLYSLGVIFYQLLTGRFPFGGETLMELLHEQIAGIPDRPSDYSSNIDTSLDEIVLKLLNKDPDNRYQSSKGFLRDIVKYSNGERDFLIGESDKKETLNHHVPVIGRNEESNRLLGKYKTAMKGNGSICFVAGEAGIGKSVLLDDFHRLVQSENAAIIESKSTERDVKNPWHLFQDLLSDYMKRFQQHTPEQKINITNLVKDECSDMGRIVMQLNPLTTELFGNCPELIKLEPGNEVQRFFLAVNRFLSTLAKAEGGLAIILEDIHWSDSGSLELLGEIGRNLSTIPIFIIGSYRCDQLDENNRLKAIAEKSGNDEISHETIKLVQLNHSHTHRLVCAVLNSTNDKINDLSDYIYGKSRGNPLFTLEIIKHLANEHVIFKGKTDWDVDLKALNGMEIPETIIDILLKRVSLLAEDDTKILQTAAAFGKTFELDLLLNVEAGRDEGKAEKVINCIKRAIKSRILEETCQGQDDIRFLHDKIQEVYYNQIRTEDKKQIHTRIAGAMMEKHGNRHDDIVFDHTHHVIHSGNTDSICDCAFPAAKKAMENYAAGDAIYYLSIVRDILEKEDSADPDKEGFDKWLECMELLGVCYASVQNPEESLNVFSAVLPHVKGELKRSFIYLQMARVHLSQYHFEECEHNAGLALSLLGENIPVTKASMLASILKEVAVHLLHNLFPFIFKKNTSSSNSRYQMILSIYDLLFWLSYFSDTRKCPLAVLKMVNISESRLGKSRELALSYYLYAVLCTAIPLLNRSHKYLNRSCKISRELNDESGMALGIGGFGMLHILKGDFRKSIDCFKKSVEIFTTTGNVLEIFKANVFLLIGYLLVSDYKNVRHTYEQTIPYLNNRYEELFFLSMGVQFFFYIETGDFETAERELQKYHSLQYEKKAWHMYCNSLVAFGHLHVEKGDVEKGMEAFKKSHAIMKKYPFPKSYLNLFYPYYASALIVDFNRKKDGLSPRERKAYLGKIGKSCKSALRWSKPWSHHYDVALRVMAQYYSLKNKNKADTWYQKSIQAGKRMEKRYSMGRTLHEYGLYLRQTGNMIEAMVQFENAYLLFDEIGVDHLKIKIADILGIVNSESDSINRIIDREKMKSILDISRELNQCHDFDNLTKLVLSHAVQISGAQAGGIFLSEDSFDVIKLKAVHNITAGDLDYSQHIINKAFTTGQSIISTNAEEDPEFSSLKSVSRLGLKSILCVPVKYNEMVNGVCYLHNPLAKGVFNETDEIYLEKLLSYAAIAIENSILNQKLLGLTGGKKQSVDTRSRHQLNTVIDYIKDHFKDRISREELADHVGMNPDYLGKQFKKYTGKSIHDYTNDLRIESAMTCLKETDETVITIALKVGFESLRTFNRIFFRKTGYTPSSFRKANRRPVGKSMQHP